jgi:methionine synthase I (cobalamin-dependent)
VVDIARELREGLTVADGACGTQLQAAGLPVGANPDAWNLERPEAVEAVGRAYVEAGARIILTNTFGANRLVLEKAGLADKAAAVAEEGAAIARRAAAGDALVFASIGPSGRIVMMGELTESEFHQAFAEQAAALARGGADAILVESFAELAEARIALGAAAETGLPVAISMTFGAGPDGTATMMGDSPGDLAAVAAEAGAVAVGANCGAGPAGFVPLARLFAAAGDLPVWVKPNAGLPEMRDGKTVYPMGPEEFAGHAAALVEAGAKILGGCCGTSPAHIRALKAAVDSL